MKCFIKLFFYGLFDFVWFWVAGLLLAVIFLGGAVVWSQWFPEHLGIGVLLSFGLAGITLWGMLTLRKWMNK